MAGPWEAYQKATSESGPWTAYQSIESAPRGAESSNDDALVRAAGVAQQLYGDLQRGGGLAARAVVNAATQLPNMVGDAANTAINYGLSGLDAVNALLTGQKAPIPKLGMPSQRTRNALDAALPTPQNAAERIIFDDVAPAVLSGGGIASLANRGAKTATGAAQEIMKLLAAEQGMQAAGNVAGAAAGGITREMGGGPAAQLIASLLGGASPSLARYAGAAGARGAIRGGESGRQQYNERLATFADAGVDPTAGQAAGTRRAQAVESISSKAPGGAGVFARKAEAEAEQMADQVRQLADSVIPNADAARAGRAVEKGLAAFVDRFKAKQGFLYDKLDQHIPADSSVDVSSTKQALATLNMDIPGAPELSKWFKNAKIQGIEGAFTLDTANAGTLPYEALKKLRTLVGGEITNSSLASDVPRSKWKTLYAALSSDMENAARAAGPDAEKAFARANAYTKAGYERIEGTLDRVIGKDTAEKIYLAVINPSETREGATTVNAVLRGLNPDERKLVTAATIKRLGQATAGNQDAAGDVFSAATFLTNWNKIGDPARRVLFSDQRVRDGLDALAKSSEMIKDGSKVFNNPSGTAPAGVGLGAGIVGALNPILGAKIVTAIGANYGAAKLMTNADFVRWVGRVTQAPNASIPVALQQIVSESKNWAPEDRNALSDFVARLTETN